MTWPEYIALAFLVIFVLWAVGRSIIRILEEEQERYFKVLEQNKPKPPRPELKEISRRSIIV